MKRFWLSIALALVPMVIFLARVAAPGPMQDLQNAAKALVDSTVRNQPPCPQPPPCPPDTTTPPPPPPPPEPDPVPPPPDVRALCERVGYRYSVSTFWRNWCIRPNTGGPCGLRWCDGPGSPPAYGIMYANTQGCVGLPPELRTKGWVEFEFFFDTLTLPYYYGGKHLFALSSAIFGNDIGPGGYYRNWSRPDVGISNRNGGTAVLSYYSADPNGNTINNHQNWYTNANVNAVQRWIKIKLAWERISPTQLRLTFNDTESKTFNVHPEAGPVSYVWAGNMDRSKLPDGTTPAEFNMDGAHIVRYRNIRWGQ